MRRCPECNSFFPDTERFCEADGTPLVPVDSTGVMPQPKSSGSLLVIGTLACVLLGVLLGLVYFAMSRQTAQENSSATSSNLSAQPQDVNPLKPAPRETADPSVEPSVEPSASPSVETPSPENSSASIELSRSPVSTAAGEKGIPVIIKLQSGLTIEADEAWQTGEGIWYRKHGVVSLLDPKNVKAIEKVPTAAPQPTTSSSPSP